MHSYKIQRFASVVLSLVLAGCANIPFLTFTPLTPEKREMNSFTIEWVVRSDASEYCASLKGINNKTLGCAKWYVSEKKCTVVTLPKTSHDVLGHEVRHCFEGHFHD